MDVTNAVEVTIATSFLEEQVDRDVSQTGPLLEHLQTANQILLKRYFPWDVDVMAVV